jgi:predicted  nucleic acid-binding Zn-ribbon protein
MHPSIEKLLAVQSVDNQVRFCREALVSRPRELESDRRKLETAKARVAEAHKRIKDARLAAQRGELEVKSCDEEIKKTTASLHQTKSNDDFAALKGQIEKIKVRRGVLEEEVIRVLDEIDRRNAELSELEAALADEQVAFAKREAEVKEITAGLEGRVEAALAERAKKTRDVDPDHLAIYQRVLDRHGNSGLAVVRDSVCQGCFMKVNQQEISLMMKGQELVQCRTCSRLLYVE